MCVAAAVAGAGLAGTVASSVISSDAAQSAADTQAGAANNATAAQLQMFNTVQQNLQPYMSSGSNALTALTSFLNGQGQSQPFSFNYNPANDPAMIHMTGLDPKVRQHVLSTPGATQLVEQMIGRIHAAHTYTRRHNLRQDAHIYCQGGRHRSVAIGEAVAEGLRRQGILVEIEHLDIDKPILPPSKPSTT